jgi:hypothetical protein
MHDVSPELALVDDALAERERGRLPDPDDCLAPTLPAAASPPTLTLLSPPPTDEPRVADRRALQTVALAEPPTEPEPAPAPPEAVPADEPAQLVEPEYAAEPAPTAERAPDVVQPEAPPPVEDAEPEAEELGNAVGEPAPAGPTSMPDWVASDVRSKSRRTRRQDRARARRDARRERPRAARRRVAVAASWVVLCGFLASPLLAFIPSPSGERPTLAPDGVQSVPDAGDDAGHALRWDPVPKAAGYSVVFVNDGVRSDRWSQGAELRLPAGTESERLVTYEWFVYPAFRDGAGYRYGPLVASGEVTMPKLAPTESS